MFSIQESKKPYLVAAGLLLCVIYSRAQSFGQAEVVYEWDKVEFEWPSDAAKEEALRTGAYVPERNLVVGVKVSNYFCLILV